jgi:hypothetical protein
VSYGRRSVVNPNLVAIGVIAVMVGIEREANRFVGKRTNLWKYLCGAGWKVGIDDQDVIFKDHPAVVAVAPIQVALVEVNSGHERIDFADFWSAGDQGFGFFHREADEDRASEQHLSPRDVAHNKFLRGSIVVFHSRLNCCAVSGGSHYMTRRAESESRKRKAAGRRLIVKAIDR